MIIDKYNQLRESAQLLMSESLNSLAGFRVMIQSLFDETVEQMLNLNPEDEEFNIKYREMQYRKREYEGLLVILNNQR